MLLHRQVVLALLEQKVLAMDHKDSDACPKALKSRQTDEGREEGKKRKILMQEIDQKLSEYGKYLHSFYCTHMPTVHQMTF